MSDRIESLEVNERESTLILDGIWPNEHETLEQTVLRELNMAVPIDLNRSELLRCNFFGPLPKDRNRPRSIKIKLNDPRTKKALLSMKGRLKPTTIFLKEHLTSKNSAAF